MSKIFRNLFVQFVHNIIIVDIRVTILNVQKVKKSHNIYDSILRNMSKVKTILFHLFFELIRRIPSTVIAYSVAQP